MAVRNACKYRSSLLLFFLLCCSSDFSFATDYDVIVAGSSPVSLMESIYQRRCGQSVVVLEKSNRCGGVWGSGTICNVPNVDLCCHNIGRDQRLLNFFANNLGCKLVLMEDPDQIYKSSSVSGEYYFSGGCNELTGNLLKMMHTAGIDLALNEELLHLYVDSRAIVHAKTSKREITSKKIILPSHFHVMVDNYPLESSYQSYKFYHLFLLVEDPAPQKFTTARKPIEGAMRIMNLTKFTQLKGTNQQLIILQISNDCVLEEAGGFLEKLKNADMLSPAALLIQTEKYIYDQFHRSTAISKLAQEYPLSVRVISSGDLHNLNASLPDWEKVIFLAN